LGEAGAKLKGPEAEGKGQPVTYEKHHQKYSRKTFVQSTDLFDKSRSVFLFMVA